MSSDLNERRFLIKKGGAYYRPNSQGYTLSAILAGRYSLQEATSITHPNGLDGPRDGMSFIHEDKVRDEDWVAYSNLLRSHKEAVAKTDAMLCDAYGADVRGTELFQEELEAEVSKAVAKAVAEEIADILDDLERAENDAWNPMQVFRSDEEVAADEVRHETWGKAVELVRARSEQREGE